MVTTQPNINPTETAQRLTATHCDEYSLTMAQTQFLAGTHADEVTFELFARTLPEDNGFLVAAGLADALEHLANLRFAADELAFLAGQTVDPFDPAGPPLYRPEFLAHLRELSFTGQVYAVPEGTVIGAQTPLVRVTAERLQATLVEAALLATFNQATGVATRAARIARAAGEAPVWDGSLRRLQGAGAGVAVARAAYIGGLTGTATVRAGLQLGIPTTGTMAHAWVQQFGEDAELEAFTTWLTHNQQRGTLLIDTYDTRRGIERAIAAARATGVALKAVRIDSGDLATLATYVREQLDTAGMTDTRIMVSGDLDEHRIATLRAEHAPIDAYLVGTLLGNPGPLGVVYKLVEQNVADEHLKFVMKRAVGKQTDPGAHQVWRLAANHLRLALTDELVAHGQPLMKRVMALGAIVAQQPDLNALRARAASELDALPELTRALVNPEQMRVDRSRRLWNLRAKLGDGPGTPPVESTTGTTAPYVTAHRALVVVDAQPTFMPGGELPVPDGDAIVAPLVDYITEHGPDLALIVFSRDWHPEDHASFDPEPRFEDGSWPAHGVADTANAEVHSDLITACERLGLPYVTVSKGLHREIEAYSSFDGVNLDNGRTLHEELASRGITEVVTAGLAGEICVAATVRAAVEHDYSVTLVEAGIGFLGDRLKGLAALVAQGARLHEADPARDRAATTRPVADDHQSVTVPEPATATPPDSDRQSDAAASPDPATQPVRNAA